MGSLYIPRDRCKHRKLYSLDARNLILGVFNSKSNGFIGLRTKMGHVFLSQEYHWDNGPPHGTAKPLEELEELPKSIEPLEVNYPKDDRLFEWLKVAQERHRHRR